LNGDIGQDSQGQEKNKIKPAASQAQTNRTEFGDRFTPSAQSEATGAAGGTGFFQAELLRFTAINIQTPAGNTATTTAPARNNAIAASASHHSHDNHRSDSRAHWQSCRRLILRATPHIAERQNVPGPW
jgi:hypothetical protein